MTEEEKVSLEQNSIDSLLENGQEFYVKAFGLKFRFRIKEPFLGTLDLLSAQNIKLVESAGKKDLSFLESSLQARKHNKRVARILAIAVLNNRFKIALFSRPLAYLFRSSLTPSKLYTLFIIAETVMNLPDFISSIRLASKMRTTMPKQDPIE